MHMHNSKGYNKKTHANGCRIKYDNKYMTTICYQYFDLTNGSRIHRWSGTTEIYAKDYKNSIKYINEIEFKQLMNKIKKY